MSAAWRCPGNDRQRQKFVRPLLEFATLKMLSKQIGQDGLDPLRSAIAFMQEPRDLHQHIALLVLEDA